MSGKDEVKNDNVIHQPWNDLFQDDDTGQKKSSHQSQKRLSRKHNEDGNNLE